MVIANKWVLNATTTPLFFLWVQIVISCLLFLLADTFKLLSERLTFNWPTLKAMFPVIGLSVLSLRFVLILVYDNSSLILYTASQTTHFSTLTPPSIK